VLYSLLSYVNPALSWLVAVKEDFVMFHWKRLLGVGAVGAAVAMLLVLPSRPGEGSKPGSQVIILASASVRGEVSPCG